MLKITRNALKDSPLFPDHESLNKTCFAAIFCGIPEAQADIGVALKSCGYAAMAAFWNQKAAAQGIARAQRDFGVMLLYAGEEKEGVFWLMKAAEQDDIIAKDQLGVAYEQGIAGNILISRPQSFGTRKRLLMDANLRKSTLENFIDWRAVSQGNGSALVGLGYLYQDGLVHGKPDVETAKSWFEKARDQGNADGQYALGVLLLRTDPEAGLLLLEKAADQDLFEASYCLGLFYLSDRKDFKTAASWFERAKFWYEKGARNGNERAFYGLGSLYDEGLLGVVDGQYDYEKAAHYYEKAAQLNDAFAQLNLGYLCESGRIGNADPVKAKSLYERAANQGITEAQHLLGCLYDDGVVGVVDGRRDYEMAASWYEKAAAHDYPLAQLNLGFLYLNGRIGENPDLEKAKILYEKAAKQGNDLAQARLGSLYYDGIIGMLDGRRNYKAAKAWLEMAADQGNAAAQIKLGRLYQRGLLGEADTEHAIFLYEKAALNGCTLAKKWLGILYEEAADYERAEKHYTESADAGNVCAQTRLAALFVNGLVVGKKRDESKAQALLETASAQGYAGAQIDLAYLHHQNGDNERAKSLYEMAAANGNPLAQYNLGLLSHHGLVGKSGRDYKRAKLWYQLAAEQGFLPAQSMLDR
eukprot:scaffold4600_cov169-Amphora_coffeaeformis.AAC.2